MVATRSPLEYIRPLTLKSPGRLDIGASNSTLFIKLLIAILFLLVMVNYTYNPYAGIYYLFLSLSLLLLLLFLLIKLLFLIVYIDKRIRQHIKCSARSLGAAAISEF
jgi:hypothetical protein